MAALIEGFSSFTSYFNKPLTTDQALGLQRLLTEIDKRIPLLTTYSLDSVLAHIYAIGLDAHDQYDLDNLIVNLDAELATVLAADDLTDPLMILERLLRDRVVSNVVDVVTLIPNAPYTSAQTLSAELLVPKLKYTGASVIDVNTHLKAVGPQEFFDLSYTGDFLIDVTFVVPSLYAGSVTLLHMDAGVDAIDLKFDGTTNLVSIHTFLSDVEQATANIDMTALRLAAGTHTPMTARIMKVGADLSLTSFIKMDETITTVDTVSIATPIDLHDPVLSASVAPFYTPVSTSDDPTSADIIALTVYEGY